MLAVAEANYFDAQKIRLVRRQAPRREAADFEIPFFDEDDGHHERSYVQVVKLQKSMFEKQRQELVKNRKSAAMVGDAVYSRLLQRTFAQQWIQQEKKKLEAVMQAASASGTSGKAKDSGEKSSPGAGAKVNADPGKPSSVLGELEKEGRGQIKLSLGPVKPKKKKSSVRKRLNFD